MTTYALDGLGGGNGEINGGKGSISVGYTSHMVWSARGKTVSNQATNNLGHVCRFSWQTIPRRTASGLMLRASAASRLIKTKVAAPSFSLLALAAVMVPAT